MRGRDARQRKATSRASWQRSRREHGGDGPRPPANHYQVGSHPRRRSSNLCGGNSKLNGARHLTRLLGSSFLAPFTSTPKRPSKDGSQDPASALSGSSSDLAEHEFRLGGRPTMKTDISPLEPPAAIPIICVASTHPYRVLTAWPSGQPCM